MKFFLTIACLFFLTSLFAQNIDTSFIISTPHSTIRVHHSSSKSNGTSSFSSYMLVDIDNSQNTIEEAERSGIKTDKFYVRIVYNEKCEIERLESIRPSSNNGFNNDVLAYFEEFKNAYNANNLKNYLRSPGSKCDSENFAFTYVIQ